MKCKVADEEECPFKGHLQDRRWSAKDNVEKGDTKSFNEMRPEDYEGRAGEQRLRCRCGNVQERHVEPCSKKKCIAVWRRIHTLRSSTSSCENKFYRRTLEWWNNIFLMNLWER